MGQKTSKTVNITSTQKTHSCFFPCFRSGEEFDRYPAQEIRLTSVSRRHTEDVPQVNLMTKDESGTKTKQGERPVCYENVLHTLPSGIEIHRRGDSVLRYTEDSSGKKKPEQVSYEGSSTTYSNHSPLRIPYGIHRLEGMREEASFPFNAERQAREILMKEDEGGTKTNQDDRLEDYEGDNDTRYTNDPTEKEKTKEMTEDESGTKTNPDDRLEDYEGDDNTRYTNDPTEKDKTKKILQHESYSSSDSGIQSRCISPRLSELYVSSSESDYTIVHSYGVFDQPHEETPLWAKCNMLKDVATADYLVQRNVLPSNRQLHKAYHTFGRRSETFSDICGMICKQIMDTAEDIVDVWASYCIENCYLDGKISIVFVVIATSMLNYIQLKDYEYHWICENTFSNESEIVLARELSDETNNISSIRKSFDNLRKCINRHADDLLEKHSNISVILPSLKRSVGYDSPNHSIIEEPCIVLYVPVKGYIPINEDPFPQELDGFATDVLEGKFETYNGGANAFHEHLKMGLAIHANILDSNKHLLGGTLGGFVNHPVYKMCGITCAHVVCCSEEISSVKLCGIKDGLDKPVFQPVNHESARFGRVVMAVYKHGDESSSGMEAALFHIQERRPEDGSFPMAFNYIKAGFDVNRPLTYNSGVVCEASDIMPRTEVYKYGMATGITRGSFELQGAVVRKERMEVNRHSFGYSLKDQLVVLQIGEGPFAEAGDSGALVLIEGDHHDSVAIGIVEGGIKNRVFVTPICDILRAFGCSDINMYHFNNLKNCSVSHASGVDVDDSEAMDVIN